MPDIHDLRAYQPEGPKGRLLILSPHDLPLTWEQALKEVGMKWDLAKDLAPARQVFFGWGGHDALLIAPGTPAGLARETAWSLREMDNKLAILTYLDPGVLGPLDPACTLISDCDLATQIGVKVLRQRMQICLTRSRFQG